jgi:hypothetical protein
MPAVMGSVSLSQLSTAIRHNDHTVSRSLAPQVASRVGVMATAIPAILYIARAFNSGVLCHRPWRCGDTVSCHLAVAGMPGVAAGLAHGVG